MGDESLFILDTDQVNYSTQRTDLGIDVLILPLSENTHPVISMTTKLV